MSLRASRFATIVSCFAILMLVFAFIGCSDDDDDNGDSTTGPTQGVPDLNGTWAFTLTTVSDTTPIPQDPGTTTPLFLQITQSGTDLTLTDLAGTVVGSGTVDAEGNVSLTGNIVVADIPISFTMTGVADSTGTSVSGNGTFIPTMNGAPAGERQVTFVGTKTQS